MYTTKDTGTAPAIVANGLSVHDVLNTIRKRPVLAINSNGELTVCCHHTARKYDWQIKGPILQNTGRITAAEQVADRVRAAVLAALLE